MALFKDSAHPNPEYGSQMIGHPLSRRAFLSYFMVGAGIAATDIVTSPKLFTSANVVKGIGAIFLLELAATCKLIGEEKSRK